MEISALLAALPLKAIAFGAAAGFFAAMRVDWKAFKSWQRWNEATTYDWNVATKRWFEGAAEGALVAAGLGWFVEV